MIYLSVDLDYWTTQTKRKDTQNLNRFVDRLLQSTTNIRFYRDHHHLLRHINRLQFNQIINVDYHSDLTNEALLRSTKERLEIGNWANFVQAKETKEFLWLYPSEESRDNGFCHSKNSETTPSRQYDSLSPFRKVNWPYAKVSMLHGWEGRIPWCQIVAAGVCLSPEFCDLKVITDAAIRLRPFCRSSELARLIDRRISRG